MYLKDKSVKLSVRLSAEQFGYVLGMSSLVGLNPSAYVRDIIDTHMVEYQRKIEGRPESEYENVKASEHNII